MARTKYTRISLLKVVRQSLSYAQVLRKLGLKKGGGAQTFIKHKINSYGINTSHFLGQAANRGHDHRGGPDKKLWNEILIKGSMPEKPVKLRRALVEFGRKYKCERKRCSVRSKWLGKRIVLQVDHKNGDKLDNRPNNLGFLCPNCHTQTPNWSKIKAVLV